MNELSIHPELVELSINILHVKLDGKVEHSNLGETQAFFREKMIELDETSLRNIYLIELDESNETTYQMLSRQ